MALVSLPSPIVWPGITGTQLGNPALATAQTLDAAGEFQGYTFVAREDMAITHVMFRSGTVAGSPTATVSIEALDASGLPTGSAGFGSTNGTTATIVSDTTVLTALGATATITKGTPFCVKITYASGTSIITQCLTPDTVLIPGYSNLPHKVTNVSGSVVRSVLNYMPIVALGSSSTTFYNVPGIMPITAYSTGAFNNTNSAKRGLRFVPPMACRAVGICWFMSTSTGNYNAVLYNDAGTELSSSSTAFDGDAHVANSNATMRVYFDNPVTLTAGTAYRIAIEPSSATNCNVSTYTLPSSNYYGATPGGTTATYTSFATATWTDSTTQIPIMDVIIDQLDDGSGGGTTVVGVIGG